MFSIFNGRTRTLGGEKSEVFLQASVDFRDYLHLFKGARLAVFMAISLHTNEAGWAYPSYEKLQRETGYGRDTIARALSDLCELEIEGHRVLLRYQPTSSDGTFQSNQYLIFPSTEEVAKYEGVGVKHLANKTGGGFEHRVGILPTRKKPYTENADTNQNQSEQEPLVVVDEDRVDRPALDALLEIGVQPRERAVELTSIYEPDQVVGWCEYAKAAGGLVNPAGLVVARLRDGVSPPPRIEPEPESEPVYNPPPPVELLPPLTVPGTDLDARDVWARVQEEIRMQTTRAAFSQWLGGSRVVDVTDDGLVVQARDPYAAEWLNTRWNVLVQRALAGVLGRDDLQVEFVTSET